MLAIFKKADADSLGPPLKFQVNIEIQFNAAGVSRLSFRFLWLWLYVDSVTYVQKANVYNHIKAGGLHVWAKKKILMDSKLEYGCILIEPEAATWGFL